MKHHTRGEVDPDIIFFGALFLAAVFGCVLFSWLGMDRGESRAYAAFRDGRAQVIEYTVPGSGKCRAVLIDGERKAEACGDR